jgi:hypothetical protein
MAHSGNNFASTASAIVAAASFLAFDRLAAPYNPASGESRDDFNAGQQMRLQVVHWLQKEELYYRAWNSYLRTEQEKYPNMK